MILVITALESRGVKRVTDRIDAGLLRAIANVRTGWLNTIMRAINRVGSGWAVTAVAGGLVLTLLAYKRWRHIFTFVGSVIVLEMIGEKLYYDFARPRPYDVTIIDRWVGFSLPSPPVVVLTSSHEEKDVVASYKLGVNAYVVKPVDFHQFVEAIKELGVFWAVINEPPPGSVRKK